MSTRRRTDQPLRSAYSGTRGHGRSPLALRKSRLAQHATSTQTPALPRRAAGTAREAPLRFLTLQALARQDDVAGPWCDTVSHGRDRAASQPACALVSPSAGTSAAASLRNAAARVKVSAMVWPASRA